MFLSEYLRILCSDIQLIALYRCTCYRSQWQSRRVSRNVMALVCVISPQKYEMLAPTETIFQDFKPLPPKYSDAIRHLHNIAIALDWEG